MGDFLSDNFIMSARDRSPGRGLSNQTATSSAPSTPSRQTWVAEVVLWVYMLVYEPIYNTILPAILPAHSESNNAAALQVLGLKPCSTEKEIQNKYKELAKTSHSDKVGGPDEGMQKLNKARDILTKGPSQDCIEASEAIANTLTIFIIMTIPRTIPFCYVLGGTIPLMNSFMIGLLGYDWAKNLSSALSGFILAFAWTKFRRFLIPVFLLRNPLTAAMWVTWAINHVTYLPLRLIKFCLEDMGAAIFQFFIDSVVVFPPRLALKVVSYWPWYFVPVNLLWNLCTEIRTYVRERNAFYAQA